MRILMQLAESSEARGVVGLKTSYQLSHGEHQRAEWGLAEVLVLGQWLGSRHIEDQQVSSHRHCPFWYLSKLEAGKRCWVRC